MRYLPLAAVLFLLVLIVPLSAHDVIVEQLVDVTVVPAGDQLVVRLHVPRNLLGTAPLEVAGADLAHSLDLQQGDTALAPPSVTGHAAADGNAVDLELRYATRDGGGPFSARLNTYDVAKGPVRTSVRYQGTAGQAQSLSVTGPPVRITFDPPAWDVVRRFASRGIRALTGGGDQLLMLLCLLLPLRRGREAAALFAAGACGQALSLMMTLARPDISAESLTAVAMIAASAVVIAALQNVARASARWALLLAFVFGALNGAGLGQTLAAAGQFAGAHVGIASAAFVSILLIGEAWFGAVAWAARQWLDDRGVPERAFVLIASAFVAHEALHRVVDRGQSLDASTTFVSAHALVLLTLGWACVMLCVAMGNLISGRTIAGTEQVQAP